MPSVLKELAEKAVAEGYRPGNNWEKWLERHMREHLPVLTKELGSDFAAYLTTRTADALDLENRLILDVTEPRLARELAIRELLPLAESDLQDQIEDLQNPYDPLHESPGESNAA